MKGKTCYIILCVINSIISLFAGLLIYILFRKNTYINRMIEIDFQFNDHVIIDYMRFYFVDALWAYSLVFSLSIIINEKISGIIVAIFSIGWEICQKTSIVAGTFDFLDIVMYLLASTIAVMIIYKFKRRHKL